MAVFAESRSMQRQDALIRANGVKWRRVALRREVRALSRKAGLVRVATLLTDREPSIASMFPIDLLRWPHRMQERWAAKYLLAVGVRDCRSVGELTDRQVALLAAMLRGECS